MYEQLLNVQELDTSADQLRHRRANLPERAELAARQADLQALEERASGVDKERHDLHRQQKRLEDEIALLSDKADQLDKKLNSGSISAARELMAMQAEIDSMKRHQSTLEDEVLELMEQIEPLDADLSAIAQERSAIDEAAAALTAALAEAEVEIDAELAKVQEQRDAAVAGVPAELVTEYDRLRKSLGGVGVARLVGANCSGCHLSLPAMELQRIRSNPDEMHHCEECGRLLVAGAAPASSGAGAGVAG